MKKYLIGVTAAAAGAIAVPLLAQGMTQQPRPPLTRAAAEALVRDKFVKADADRDGAVTQVEVDAAMAAGKADRQARMATRRAERFAALDINHDGQLSRGEFTAPGAGRANGERHGARGDRGMRGGRGGFGQRWFVRADANKDGRVTLAEASAAAMARFDKTDANHDGTISADERRAARSQMRGSKQD